MGNALRKRKANTKKSRHERATRLLESDLPRYFFFFGTATPKRYTSKINTATGDGEILDAGKNDTNDAKVERRRRTAKENPQLARSFEEKERERV